MSQPNTDPQSRHRVLIVEDDLSHARLMLSSLRDLGCELVHAGTQEAAIRLLKEDEYDVVLLDMGLPDGNGFELQQWLSDNALSSSIVFVTADDLAEHAVRAVRSGAAHYVVKRPDYLDQLAEATLEALDARAGLAARVSGDSTNAIAQNLAGWSASIVEVRKLIVEFAQQLRPVLIVGEPGTGRSVVSRLIHSVSGRTGPCVVVGCRDLSERIERASGQHEELIDRMVETAVRGTLILEGITEATAVLQRELIAVISELPQRDVRLIAESECDLGIEAAESHFLDGLWVGLNGTRIELAPLRDRKEDIRPIAMRELSRLSMEKQRGRFEFDDDAWATLETHGWSGNVHELLSCVRTIVASSDKATRFDRYDAEAALRENERRFTARSQHEQKERTRLKAALGRHDWNVTATAKSLGVSRGWLRRRIEWFEL